MGILDLFRQWQESRNGQFRPRRRGELTRVEQLEVRRVLSPVTVAGTTLNVNAATNAPITITNTGGVNGLSVIVDNGFYGNLGTITAINVVGSPANDLITINGPYAGIDVNIDGGGGFDTLISTTQNNNWLITGPNSGVLNGNISFTNIQNLTGGNFGDDFQFASSGYVDGQIDGGLGVNALDYQSRNAGAIVNLNLGMATAVGSGFTNINTFDGSADGTDMLIGTNADRIWHVSSGNTGDINGQFKFVGVENLIGGTGEDRFLFAPNGFVDGMITGGFGENSLDYSSRSTIVVSNLEANTSTAIGSGFNQITKIIGSTFAANLLIGSHDFNDWSIDNNNQVNGALGNSGTVTNSITSAHVIFLNFQNLSGGIGNNTFHFSSTGFISGKLLGSDGNNTLDYSGRNVGAVVNLNSKTATAIGGGFAGIQNFVGSGAVDTLIGANKATDWNVNGPNSGNVNGSFFFSSVENLSGGTQNDTFHFLPNGFVNGIVYGGLGTNTLDYSVRARGIVVNLQTSSATAIGAGFQYISNLIGTPDPKPDPVNNFNTLIGANTANTWDITGNNSGTVNKNFTFTNIENLTGGQGVDVFRLSASGFVAGKLNGGGVPNGAAAGGDWLDYSALLTPVTVNLTSGAATGFGVVKKNGIVVKNIGADGRVFNIQNVHGGSGSNTLIGSSVGNILVGGSASDSILGGNGSDLLIGGFGADTVTGGSGQDIVIGSYTTYDDNLPALAAIFAEWRSANTLVVRVNHLRNGGGLNFTKTLVADVTVLNDVAPDVVTGAAGPNWLWAQPAELTDKTLQDIVDTPINNVPILTGATNAVYTVNSLVTPVSSSIVINATTSSTLTSATVQITGAYLKSEDNLGFVSSATTGNIVGSFDVTTGKLTLTSAGSSATVAQFQLALQKVVYWNSNPNASTTPRTISYQVFDGANFSNTTTSTLYINYAPTLAGSTTITYAANQDPTVINNAITIDTTKNVGNGSLSYATVKITRFYYPGEDFLFFLGDATTGNIVGNFDTTTGTMTLTSSGANATAPQFQAALQRVLYFDQIQSPATIPSIFPRTVTYQVFDGFALSNTVNSTITIVQ